MSTCNWCQLHSSFAFGLKVCFSQCKCHDSFIIHHRPSVLRGNIFQGISRVKLLLNIFLSNMYLIWETVKENSNASAAKITWFSFTFWSSGLAFPGCGKYQKFPRHSVNGCLNKQRNKASVIKLDHFEIDVNLRKCWKLFRRGERKPVDYLQPLTSKTREEDGGGGHDRIRERGKKT